MNKKISDKDKKTWEKFVNSKERVFNKDQVQIKSKLFNIEKSIDLHGFSLEEANKIIEKFIYSCFEDHITKINVITGKGSRSKNFEDPYQSKDLSLLKHSVPNYIKQNENLMNKILKIDYESVENPLKGNFNIILKKKSG